MSLEAWIVFDLGFGDAGKGAATDFLVRDRGARLVVRWNGGGQAGHRVVAPDGRAHVFSQIGSGSFVAGVRTHLGPGFVLHPGGLLVEALRLAEAGVPDALARLSLDRDATLVTPFQQAAGRLRELGRGEARHGTCGVGVGEAVSDALAGHGDALRAGDLGDGARLLRCLAAQQERKRSELAEARQLAGEAAALEWAVLDDPAVVGRAAEACRALASRVTLLDPDEGRALMLDAERVVFEGAQGVLLDEVWGFHPHTTWSDTTPAGALRLLEGTGAEVRRLGLLRAYATRHGEGPLPTEEPAHPGRLDPENRDGGWQGPFRAGPLDLVLLAYALEASGWADGLAVSCLDRAGDPVRLCRRYDGPFEPGLLEDRAGRTTLVRGPADDLGHGERLAGLLRAARPVIEEVPAAALPDLLEETLGVPVWLEARGPRAADRGWRPCFERPAARPSTP